ncbi:bacterial low temperature requirement A protein-domain-containing protein [Spinellus fusiger]|nr:bacterial low temperature requirement A protein-domain-containing protein [Spinellus fusiger]
MSNKERGPGSSPSVRRGPTLRGDRSFRPPIGKLSMPTRQKSTSEETQSLTSSTQLPYTYEEEEGPRMSIARPTYHHTDETYGQIIAHPIEEFHAHQQRVHEYQDRIHEWEEHEFTIGNPLPTGMAKNSWTSILTRFCLLVCLVVHFRQLRGNQSFVLDQDKAIEFSNKIQLTPQQRIQFNGVRDTDGLTAFLYKTNKEFSIKIHHKTELSNHEKRHSEMDMHHVLEHNPDHHTIEFNENVYVEFKPVHHAHHELPVEATRRPFFQHPEPDLSADIGQEKAASWLELFYDLFYVATLTEFTHTHVIKDWESLGMYTSWFIITWWGWTASSLYTSRFDTDDVLHHIWRLIEMCAVIGMAGTADHFLNSRGYVYGYLVLKAVLVLEYSIVLIVAIMARSKSRMAFSFYVGANIISMILWGASLLIIDQEIHRLLWYLGVLAEVLVNVIVRDDKALSWAASHLAERLGLLSLIVLGENLMGLVKLVAEAGTEFLVIVPNFMAVVIIFGFFFMYFEDFNKEVFLHSSYHQIWVYLHFPLHLCQVAFGIALTDTLVIYKHQMILSGKIKNEEKGEHAAGAAGAASTGEHEAAAPAGEHGAATPTAPTEEHGAAAPAAAHGAARRDITIEEAHALAKRAILSTTPKDGTLHPIDIQPVKNIHVPRALSKFNSEGGYLTLGKHLVGNVVMVAFQAISSSDSDSNVSTVHHSFMRRGSEEEVELTDQEKVFVYKAFLIFGGAVLVINSLIKLLNTRVTDIYGKIIIGSRVLNAAALWAMCALPFSNLGAFVLLSVMMGSLIFQGKF